MSSAPGMDIHAALRLHQTGDLSQAEALYRQILEADPEQADAHHLLGVLAHQTGRFAAAAQSIREALRLRPGVALYHCNLGAALQELGESDAAIEHYRQTLTLAPKYAQAYFNLGVALESLGRTPEANEAYTQTLRLEPGHPQAHNNLGNALLAEGRPEAAELHFRQAIETFPDFAEAHFNLGNALRTQGQLQPACNAFKSAIKRKPDYVEAHFTFANILRQQGESDRAIETYRQILQLDPLHANSSNNLAILLREGGLLEETEAVLLAALRYAPLHARLNYNLGNLYLRMSAYSAAMSRFQIALATQPDFAQAHNNVGYVHRLAGRHGDAIACFRQAIALKMDFAEAYNNLGLSLHCDCRQAESLGAYKHALRLKPDYVEAHSNFLLALNYHCDFDPGELYREHCRWDDCHGRVADPLPPYVHDRDPFRKLRIGYVSPDFRGHAVSYFVEPILTHHDPRQFEVFAYAEVSAPDSVTERLQRLVPRWRSTFGLSDRQIAQQIRQDRIDILVDLAGHTAGNRLQMFALKPAPVQVTGLGYGTTTGLRSIDYRLTDPVADPPGEPRRHTEELVRLPQGVYCYQAPSDAPPVGELPALRNGFVTFGSFNNLAKLTPQALELWCRVLERIPTAKLLLKHRSLEDPQTRELFRRQFVKHGIGDERLELVGQIPSVSGHLDVYGRVDIALDPFPYTGLTTTYESLWMGVPVLTLRGTSFVGRLSASVLTFSGMTDLIAETPAEYVSQGVRLANDLEGLARRRSEMRTPLAGSPACDAIGYTRHLEQAYREMWRSWCIRQGDPALNLLEKAS